jgi:hypothetical protein
MFMSGNSTQQYEEELKQALTGIEKETRILAYQRKHPVSRDQAEAAIVKQDEDLAKILQRQAAFRANEALRPAPSSAPVIPFTAEEIQNLLTIQTFQFRSHHRVGRYLEDISVSHDNAYGPEYTYQAGYRLPQSLEDLLPEILRTEVADVKRRTGKTDSSPGLPTSVDSHAFSPFVLTLCDINREFKTDFATQLSQLIQNQNSLEAERAAFIAAFKASNFSFSPDAPFIQDIQAHADKKPERVQINGRDVDSPKKRFLLNLITALTLDSAATETIKNQAIGNLFDTNRHERLRQNTGFWGWLRNLLGKQTKTWRFATAFLSQPREISVMNPLVNPPAKKPVDENPAP